MEIALASTGLVFAVLFLLSILVQPNVLQLSVAMVAKEHVPWGKALTVVLLGTIANWTLACGLGWTGVGIVPMWVLQFVVWAWLCGSILKIDFAKGAVAGIVMWILNMVILTGIGAATGVTFLGVNAIAG